MKEIVVNSPKFGEKIVQVDDEDFESLINFTWHVTKQRNNWDMNGLNNQKENLRIASYTQNAGNVSKRPKTISNYKGVCYETKKYKGKIYSYIKAQITINRKCILLGYFKTEQQAAIAYNQAAKLHFGEFANINTAV